jgi:ABC-type spermidine/putrescine transport system permease subunit II
VYQTLVWAAVVLLIVGPFIPILYSSLQSKPFYLPNRVFTFAAYGTLFADPAYWTAVRNSLAFATLLTAIAVPTGTVFAILCHRTDLPLAGWFSRLLLAPIVIPPLGLILGWIVLYGDGGYVTQAVQRVLHLPTWQLSSIPGMAVLGAVVATPIAYVTCRAALEGKDSALEDAAASLGAGPLTVLIRVTVPMLRPAILNCAVLIFALGLEVLGIPLLIGSPSNIDMYASYLYKAWTRGLTPDPPYVSAGALVLLLVVTTLLLLRSALLGSERRFGAVGPRGGGVFRRLSLGRWRYPLAIATGAFVIVTSLIPLLGIVLMSLVNQLTILVPPWELFTLENWQNVISDVTLRRSIVNSPPLELSAAGHPGPGAGLSPGGPRHRARDRLLLGVPDRRSAGWPDPEQRRERAHRACRPQHHPRLRRDLPVRRPDQHRARARRAGRRRGMVDRGPARVAPDAPAGAPRRVRAHVRRDGQRLRLRGLPAEARHRGDGGHDAPVLDQGDRRLRRGPRHGPARHRRRRALPGLAGLAADVECLTSRSAT